MASKPSDVSHEVINTRKLTCSVRDKSRNREGKSEQMYSAKFCLFDFHIGKIIGSGCYSKIRMAYYDGAPVAVKIVDRSYVSDLFEYKFLPREIEALTKLRHPNVIQVMAVHNYADKTYIFMEWMKKGNLFIYVTNQLRLSQEESRYWIKQILEGLSYMHSFGVAHRDLKPDNILFDTNYVVKISDFGFVTKVNDKERLSKTFCGSTMYASPEILEGVPYKPPLYDSWSAGCILFLLYTGAAPFTATSIPNMLDCQLSQIFNYPNCVPVVAELDNLVRKMLEPDMDKRWTCEKCLTHNWLTSGEAKKPNSEENIKMPECNC